MKSPILSAALVVSLGLLTTGCKSEKQFASDAQRSARSNEATVQGETAPNAPSQSGAPVKTPHALVGKWIGSYEGGTDNVSVTISDDGNLRAILTVPAEVADGSATTKPADRIHVARGKWMAIDADGIRVVVDSDTDATTRPEDADKVNVELIDDRRAVMKSANETILMRRAE
jgi:hypothetical protein